jgi:hypothetical protein
LLLPVAVSKKLLVLLRISTSPLPPLDPINSQPAKEASVRSAGSNKT